MGIETRFIDIRVGWLDGIQIRRLRVHGTVIGWGILLLTVLD